MSAVWHCCVCGMNLAVLGAGDWQLDELMVMQQRGEPRARGLIEGQFSGVF